MSEEQFGIGVLVGRVWMHAVDLDSAAAREVLGDRRVGRAAVAVCGEPVNLMPGWGPFRRDSRRLRSDRCPRCGWIVALNQGSADDEIAWYRQRGTESGLFTNVLAAILADVSIGTGDSDRGLQPGRRSELLAHASLHAPVSSVCEGCAGGGGHRARECVGSQIVCWACTFAAGAGGAECVVKAPCSTLMALGEHYGLLAVAGVQSST